MRDRQAEYDAGILATTDGQPPVSFSGVPNPETNGTGQHKSYWVLSDEELAKGFVRPVRYTYRHETCGTVTSMGRKLAETYAAKPEFYGSTFCVHCGTHRPVGEHGEFVWDGTSEKVGT